MEPQSLETTREPVRAKSEYFKKSGELDITSDFVLAKFYHRCFNSRRFIFSSETATWFYYRSDNVLRESTTKNPFKLRTHICNNLDFYFRNLLETQDENKEAIQRAIKHVGSGSFADTVISFLLDFNNNDELQSLTDNNTNLLAFNNGFVFDVKENAYRKIERDDFITKTLSIPYEENVPEEAENEIYRIVFSFFENEEMTDYFLKVLAVSLFTNKHEKLNILTGSGRNGKSLIMNFLNGILNDYSTVAETDFLTSQMKNGISCSLVNATNTRMILVSEPSGDRGETKLNNTLIKTITGNDKITARALYKNTISFNPTFNVFMLCNEIPSLSKIEKAMVERLNIIKFRFTFVEKRDLKNHENNREINKDLKKKLNESTELKQAFLKILFKLAHENIDKNLTPPQEIEEARDEYLEETDLAKQFLRENIIHTECEKDRLGVKAMFEVFKNRGGKDVSFRDFTRIIDDYGLTKTKYCGSIFVKNVKFREREFVDD